MKIKILALVLSLSALYSGIALGADGKRGKKQAKKSDNVTILDLSGPAEPESKFPTITDKGKL